MRMLVRMLWLSRGMPVSMSMLRTRLVIYVIVFVMAMLGFPGLLNAKAR